MRSWFVDRNHHVYACAYGTRSKKNRLNRMENHFLLLYDIDRRDMINISLSAHLLATCNAPPLPNYKSIEEL